MMLAIKSILDRYQGQGREALLPALIDLQEANGYLTREIMEEVHRRLKVPLSDIWGVATFYSMLYTEPVGRRVIRVCESVPCAIAGSEEVARHLASRLGIEPGGTTADGEFTLEMVPCLGGCDRPTAILANGRLYQGVTAETAWQVIEEPESEGEAEIALGGTARLLLQYAEVPDLHRLHGYLAQGGFRALGKALREMQPGQVIAEIKASGLQGRGGAAFPTGLKWDFCARAPGHVKYVVCNADESEPGTFKDRWLMERDPFPMLEGMILAGYAVGAREGYVYIRGEYPLAYRRVVAAVEEAARAGYLGEDILGSGFSFRIHLRRGAGAYICGEETALFESIEGKRGMPRVKPPFPTAYGLFGKPTVINNVETLANVPGIVLHGASWYRQWGTEKSPGTRLFCLSGHVARPGLYEVPLGTPLRELIYDLGGGVPRGRQLKAVMLGGAAGTFLTPDQLDLRLDFESTTAAGATMGSGAVMVFDDTVDVWRVALNFARFFAHESCGKCFPCQLGTQRQVEILAHVVEGEGVKPGDSNLLTDIAAAMTDASICGLGQTAASAVLSALEHWGLPVRP